MTFAFIFADHYIFVNDERVSSPQLIKNDNQQVYQCFCSSSKQVLRSQRSRRSRPCWMHLKVTQQGSPKVNFSCSIMY